MTLFGVTPTGSGTASAAAAAATTTATSTGGFQLGVANTSTGPSQMDLSLDDIMKARAKSNVADRVIGTRAARSRAAKNARRGITTSKDATPQQIAQEVQKQTLQRTVKQAAQNIATIQQQQKTKKKRGVTTTTSDSNNMDTSTPANRGRKNKVTIAQQTREMNQAAQQLAATATGNVGGVVSADNIPIPTRAMIEAAKTAMINAGYIFPDRTTLHVVPIPSRRGNKAATVATTTATTAVAVPSNTFGRGYNTNTTANNTNAVAMTNGTTTNTRGGRGGGRRGGRNTTNN